MRRAKIVCTIGPASRDEEILRELIDSGMDVVRMNFSHGSHEEHREVFDVVRRLNDRVAVMQDLQGPKIRLGDISGGELHLEKGEIVTLTTSGNSGGGKLVPVTYPELPGDVSPGDNIYIADGIIHLEVEKVRGADVDCRTIHGGVITSRKGVNLPGVRISAPALTGKDREDLEFGLELGVDFVALSFVRSAGEVEEVKNLVKGKDSSVQVVAKIEKREALEALDKILEVADAVMIARGDLGVEISTEEVPIVQKSIIDKCLRIGKPVITATQMLESMVFSERPTRAEASDVANAVIDGTDSLMLSAETATGRYPVESVRIMDRIVRKVEGYYEGMNHVGMRKDKTRGRDAIESECAGGTETLADAVSAGAVKVAEEVGASAIACLAHTGNTAKMIAKYRPRVPILALTDFPPVVRHMALVWGVEAIPVERLESTEKIFAIVRGKVKEAGYGGKVVLTAGIPTRERGPTNTVHVIHI